MSKIARNSLFLLTVWASVLWACSGSPIVPTNTNIPSSQVVSSTLAPTITPIPPTPTPTPEPLAVIVNGEGITLADYQDELRRFQDANPNYSGDAQSFVLGDLINQMLLAQGAQEAGFEVDEAMLETRLTQLIDGVGGETAFSDWLEANHYTIESFKRALSRAIASAWMRDQIASSVPQEMEQVHARQILLADMNQAIEVVAQLESGKDFATLALVYDPIAMGDLGWFPRGYLADAKLEEAAFNLQPNEVSDIIETSMGYHLIQVIERDPARPLEPDALLVLQQKAVANWLEQRKAQSKVIINLP